MLIDPLRKLKRQAIHPTATNRRDTCRCTVANGSIVVDSRSVHQGRAIRRRRVCSVCDGRYTTMEIGHANLGRMFRDDEATRTLEAIRDAMRSQPMPEPEYLI